MADEWLVDHDALSLASLVRNGEVSAELLLEQCIGRLERLDPSLNAVIQKMYDDARRYISEEMPPEAPFRGVPFLLKDYLADYRGSSTSNGSRFFRDNIAIADSELVARFKALGLVVVGKTNTPELAASISTEPLEFGPTRNPWDLTRSAGGSSGGSAAAVAARLVPLAHGTDAGGSIRIPASCCGVFGMKPTRGRNPTGPHYAAGFLSVEHALSRSVRDSAALLDGTLSTGRGAPRRPELPYVRLCEQDPPPLRVAFMVSGPSGEEIDSECVRAVSSAARLLVDLGHYVEEGWPNYNAESLGNALRLLVGATGSAFIRAHAQRIGRSPERGDLEDVVARRMKLAESATATDYELALDQIGVVSRCVDAFFEDFDVVMTPTVASPPPLLGTFRSEGKSRDEWLSTLWNYMPFTGIFNATGLPAMSVPLYWTPDGLPIGVQFAGKYGAEDLLFRLAGQLERSVPWADRWPSAIG